MNSGATRMPATPASNPDSANAASTTRRRRMPINRVGSPVCTTASSALPCRVTLQKNACSTGGECEADHGTSRWGKY